MDRLTALAAPLGRLLLGGFFALAGFNKIGGYAATQGYMEAFGIPGQLLPLVIALEIGGGLALIAGWQTRLVALLLAGFCVVSAVIFHADFADGMQQILFMKNFAIAGGFLIIAAHGPGALALDGRGRTAGAGRTAAAGEG